MGISSQVPSTHLPKVRPGKRQDQEAHSALRHANAAGIFQELQKEQDALGGALVSRCPKGRELRVESQSPFRLQGICKVINNQKHI